MGDGTRLIREIAETPLTLAMVMTVFGDEKTVVGRSRPALGYPLKESPRASRTRCRAARWLADQSRSPGTCCGIP
jgi:hypothetical protein